MKHNYSTVFTVYLVAVVSVLVLDSCSFVKQYEYEKVMSFYDDLSKKTDKATTIEEISMLIDELNQSEGKLSNYYSYSFSERMAIDRKASETISKMKDKLNIIMLNSGMTIDGDNANNSSNMNYLVSY